MALFQIIRREGWLTPEDVGAPPVAGLDDSRATR